ncbi:GAD-like domain-containing protein [Bosea sp. (in: a-proteobacteria)]|uniref:GAD-like domain-containing protein n=1 Tax=Bosea sp. (in: a-proteobacteria) TaxID=1871050 RepID=UPI003B3A5F47
MTKLSEDFEYFLERFGRPVGGGALDEAVRAAYRGKVPDSLTDFWEEVGIGLVLDGYFQLCDPRRYAPVVERLFGADPQLDAARLHLLGFSAMGSLLLWHEIHRAVRVRLPNGEAVARDLLRGDGGGSAEISLGTALTMIDAASYDQNDTSGKHLFKRARKALGPLKLGQIYGFKPALALGGEPKLENLAIYGALEHFSILADLAALRLMDYSKPQPRFVREIG